MRPLLKGTAADSVGKAIYVLILFFLPAILFARSDSIRFQKLSPRHAPAPRNVSCILQDHIGFLWFGTDNGLYRYDGRTLVVHRNSRENPKSICSNAIKALCEDSMGNLWVGTERGLNRFDRTTSTFTRYMADSNNPSGMISNGINTMIIGRSGTLWVGSWEGLSKYDSKADTFTHFRNDFRNPTSLSCNIVETIFEDTTRATDSETVLWIGTGMLTTNNGGLNRFDRKSGTFTTYKHDPGDITSLADNWVTAVRRSRKGILWVGTNGGLDRFDEVKKKFIHYRFDQWKSGKRGSNHVKAIHEDASGILWIGTWGGGLVRFDQATETFQLYMNDPDDDASLSNNNVVTLSEDITGTLWVGTFGGGICRLDRTRQPFRSFVHDEHLNSSLRDNLVYSIIEDRSGMVLLGTGTGLDVFDPRAEVFTHYYPLSGFPVLSLLEDVNGTLWTGLLGGLTKIQPVPFKRHFYGMYGAVSSIYRGREGILWMFSYDGLFQFHPTTGHFVSMNLGQGLTESAENLILDDRAVSKEGPRGLWIGSNEGLFHYDALTEALTRYANDSQKPNSLATDLVRSLYQDKNGILWVGTDRGLQQLDPQSGTFKRPSGNGGLPNDYVLGILEDDQGRLWLSTNTEIWRYDPRTSLVTNYDAGDGVPSNQFKPGSCLRSSTGDMYFGGNKGLLRFHPNSIRDNAHVPPIVITGLEVSDAQVSLDTVISEKKEITFSHEQNAFSFGFVALDFLRPEKNQYAYKLDGYDDDWIYCANQQIASYRNVEPGNYVFRVKGSNNDGIWNEEGTSITVIITPPWWGTWWFRTIGFITLLGVVGGTIRYIEIARLRRKMRLLEQQQALERERIRISGDLHDELATNLTSIAMLSKILSEQKLPAVERVDHSQLLDRITTLSSQSVESIRDIIWAIDPKDETLESLLLRMCDMLVSLCRAKNIQLHFEQPLSSQLPSANLQPELRRNLWLLLKEGVNNAMKHSGCTELTIDARYSDESLRIELKDNGKGFDAAAVTPGRGLRTMKMRAEQIKGTLAYASSPGKGTTISLAVKTENRAN